MCLMTLKDFITTIKNLIHQENKIVSGPLLSQTLDVTPAAARRLLEQYVSDAKDKLAVFYLVSGSHTNSNGYKVQRNTIVPQCELESAQQELESPIQQLFAVAQEPAPSLPDVVRAASLVPSLIKFKIHKKPVVVEVNGKSSAPTVEPKVKKEATKPEVKKEGHSKPVVKKEEDSKPAEKPAAKPQKSKRGKSNKGGDVRSMFSKQSTKPTATPKSTPAKPPSPPPKERSPFDSESEEEVEEKKPTLQPKRRRIMALSDSEEEIPSVAETKEEPMEEDEPIPPTPPTRTKRSFQTVSQTYQDDDGFMVTKKEKVFVEEEETQPPPPPLPQPKPAPKKAPKLMAAGPKKQANILSFFGKKAK